MQHKLTDKQIDVVIENGARALYCYVRSNKLHYLVTGVSGGTDSATALGFAGKVEKMAKEDAYELHSVGIIMPCQSDSDAQRLGELAISRFGTQKIFVDFTELFEFAWSNAVQGVNSQVRDILLKTGGEKALKNMMWAERITQGNIKARLRMTFGTYHVARLMEGIVLSTDNLSELWMAFWTLHGDVGDYGIIQNVLKGFELYDIARRLGVPEEILESKPDDGLGIAGGDEDQLGASYPIVDEIMIKLIQAGFNPNGNLSQLGSLPGIEGDYSLDLIRKIAERCINGSFKREGSIALSREFLGLPSVEEIKL